MAEKLDVALGQLPGAWEGKELVELGEDKAVLLVDQGTKDGKPTMIIGGVHEGTAYTVEISYRLFLQLRDLAVGRYGELDRSDMPWYGEFTVPPDGGDAPSM